MDHANLVVQTFYESQRHFILRLAIGGDAVPVTVDHRGELLVGLEALPLERGAPVLKEAPSPTLPLVVPQLPELLLEDIGRVQPPTRKGSGLAIIHLMARGSAGSFVPGVAARLVNLGGVARMRAVGIVCGCVSWDEPAGGTVMYDYKT